MNVVVKHQFGLKEWADLCEQKDATIAALQARVQELEGITKVICGHCCEPMEIPSKAVLQSQLTQRTAERDCVRRRVDELEAREVDVVLLREDLEKRTAELEAAKQWKLQLCNLTPGGSEFADDPAYCAEWVRKSRENQHNVILDKYREAKALKAELERVRGERDALREQNRVLRSAIDEYAKAKTDFDDKRLQEDHHAWRERYTRLVGAETILIALTATSQEGQG
jgi:hypothetical protein